MKINQDVLRGREERVKGSMRQAHGERTQDYREAALGNLQRTAGALQERRGICMWRMERARRRLEARAFN